MVVVDIWWVDAGLKMGWQEAGDVVDWMMSDDPFLVNTVGFLFAEDNDMVTIVMGHSGGNVLNPVRIRTKNIISMKELSNGTQAEREQADSGSVGYGEQAGAVADGSVAGVHSTQPSGGGDSTD